VRHDSKLTRRTLPADSQRIGIVRSVLILVVGVLALNLLALFSPTLAVVVAGTVVVLAVTVFMFTLFRKH
jgi:uncharacterized membrane protein